MITPFPWIIKTCSRDLEMALNRNKWPGDPILLAKLIGDSAIGEVKDLESEKKETSIMWTTWRLEWRQSPRQETDL